MLPPSPAPPDDTLSPLAPFDETPPHASFASLARAQTLRAVSSCLHPGPLRMFEWLPRYTPAKFSRDVVAALVVTTLLVPQSMSYAKLIGMGTHVEYGLYSSVVPLFVHGALTTSSTIQFGIVAPTSILAYSIVAGLLPGAADGSPAFIAMQLQLAFASGLILAGMSLLRLSWLADLISGPVIAGFTWGSALLIIASQLADLFGIPVVKENYFGPRVRAAISAAGSANPYSVAIGSLCLLVLLYAKDLSWRGRRLLPRLTPVPLLVLVVLIGTSYACDLAARGVRVVGPIPSSLPPVSFPFPSPALPGGESGGAQLLVVLPQAVLLAIVGYVQTLSVASVFAAKRGEALSPAAEMRACAAANAVGACFGGLSVSGSFTRTAVAHEAGVASQAGELLVGCMMLLAIAVLTPVLRFLPAPALAAVVVASTRSLLDPAEPRALAAGAPGDFAVFLATTAAILALDVQNGLFAGIGASMLAVLCRAFRPRTARLGRLPGTEVFVDLARYAAAAPPRGMLLLRVDGELSFGNIRGLTGRLAAALAGGGAGGEGAPPPPPPAGPPAAGRAAQAEAPAAEAPAAEAPAAPSGWSAAFRRVARGSGGSSAAPAAPAAPHRTVYATTHGGAPRADARGALLEGGEPPAGPHPRAAARGALLGGGEPPAGPHPPARALRAVVLDCSRVPELDATACRELGEAAGAFARARVPLLCAALPGPARDRLAHFGLDGDWGGGGGGCASGASGGAGAGAPITGAGSPRGMPFFSTRFLSVAAAVAAVEAAEEAEEAPPGGGPPPTAEAAPPPAAEGCAALAAGAASV